MKRKKGPIGSIIAILFALALIGVFLAVLAQFDGDLGAMIEWSLTSAWRFVSTVRDTVANWDTFQGLFN